MSHIIKPTERELRAQRRRRLWKLGAAAGLAAGVVIVAAVVSSGGTPAPKQPPADAAALFRGIPERNGVLGDPDAPVTVTEFVDLQCPVCASTARSTLPMLVDDYVRTGKVKLEARTLHFLGPDSVRAAQVAAGAERQGRLWPFLEAFYAAQGPENSGYVTDDFLRSVAAAAGVDADAALGQADSDHAQQRLARANADAGRLGVDSTPTFTTARGDGAPRVIAVGQPDPAALRAALDAETAR